MPWNIVYPEIFHCIAIFLSLKIFEELALALKTKFVMKFFAAFWTPALALKNRICPENFNCIEIFFIFQDFWASSACPENRVCPEFFKPGGGRHPCTPASYATGSRSWSLEKRDLRSRSHTHENQELRSRSHVHEKKSSRARAVAFLRRLCSPEIIYTVAGHTDDPE